MNSNGKTLYARWKPQEMCDYIYKFPPPREVQDLKSAIDDQTRNYRDLQVIFLFFWRYCFFWEVFLVVFAKYKHTIVFKEVTMYHLWSRQYCCLPIHEFEFANMETAIYCQLWSDWKSPVNLLSTLPIDYLFSCEKKN